jgi:hypothetical protein
MTEELVAKAIWNLTGMLGETEEDELALGPRCIGNGVTSPVEVVASRSIGMTARTALRFNKTGAAGVSI